MSTLFTLTFILGCVGIWYFIKKVPNKKNRNISIATVIISILLISIFTPTSSENSKQDTKAETKQTSTLETKNDSTISSEVISTTTQSSAPKIDLLLEIPSEIESDSSNKATISGKTNPGARVSVGLGIVGDATEADNDGNFSLVYDMTGDENKELTIYTSIDKDSKSSKITIKPNAQVLAAKAEQKAAAEAAKKQEEERKQLEASLPPEYKSALTKAQSYSEIMNMSKVGIYEQLISEYGEQFAPEAAQYAVDNLQADYNANALAKAKSYQEQMAMSPEAIRDQLISEYGEQFTPEEAEYAIQHLNE